MNCIVTGVIGGLSNDMCENCIKVFIQLLEFITLN
jgi:hypothetical protein